MIGGIAGGWAKHTGFHTTWRAAKSVLRVGNETRQDVEFQEESRISTPRRVLDSEPRTEGTRDVPSTEPVPRNGSVPSRVFPDPNSLHLEHASGEHLGRMGFWLLQGEGGPLLLLLLLLSLPHLQSWLGREQNSHNPPA